MKKFVLLFALVVSVAMGIEVTGVVGLNTQSWNDGNDNIGSGVGLHAGLLGSIGITPSCLPVYVGLESGFLYQNANYTWEDAGFDNVNLSISLHNVVIPILLKGNFKPTKKLSLGAALGPSIIIHSSGSWEYDVAVIQFEDEFNKDNLAADLGFQIKGDVGIKLAPMLWLKPSVTLQLNGNPDNPFNTDERVGAETALFFSLELALKI
ncbi:MAG: hypothetical protein E3J71_06305 [Candidatus Stahlbacteria bacterium]|nr:MAG: hypothetical protein E3J71_06305 [Candidatus Stahlbacteria bacterium]